MTSIATFPTTIAQFVQTLPTISGFNFTNLFSRKQETALDRAFAQFSEHYRNEVDALFDEHFLSHAGEPILNDFAADKLSRHEAVDPIWHKSGPISLDR